MNYASAIKSGGFGHEAVRRGFNRLVERDDYSRTDKRALLVNLDLLSNPLRTTEIANGFAITTPLARIRVAESV